MSDTIVVTAPNPATNLPSYGGGIFPAGHSSPNQGQIFLQVTLPYYASYKFCLDTLLFLEDYINKHSASDPLTLQVVANNIRYFCNADTNLVKTPRMTVYDAYHSRNPAPAYYDYHSMNIPEMSGNVTTPIAAMAHFIWGNGQTRSVKLTDVGLKIHPNQIPQIMNIVNSGVVGSFPISTDFSRNTGDDNVIAGAYLGHITMKTEGMLNIDAAGNWGYSGVGRAYNDVFDFNLGDFRGPVAEASTRLGAKFTGTPYQIALPGEIPITGTGKR